MASSVLEQACADNEISITDPAPSNRFGTFVASDSNQNSGGDMVFDSKTHSAKVLLGSKNNMLG